MVSWLLAADEKARPLWERLDPVSRTRVVMALLGLVLVGVALVLVTILAGRRLRRIARHRPGKTAAHEDDWYRKPLAGRDERDSTHDSE
jgi:hypothetical protein